MLPTHLADIDRHENRFNLITGRPVRSLSAIKSTHLVLICGALVTAAVCLVYLSLFWNHFVGFRSGSGDFGGGMALLTGRLPYRDYFTASTPLTIFKSAAVLSLFGKAYIVTRAFGVFERICLGVLVYLWLVRLFRPSDAALAAFVTLIVSSGDLADPIASYNHDAILLAVGAGLVASFALDQERSSRSLIWIGILSGLLGGFSFATKQTIGLGAVVVPLIVGCACLLRLEGLTKSTLFCLGFCCGVFLSVGILLLWLQHAGILQTFFNQVFVKGPAAKGSHPGEFFRRYVFVLKERKGGALVAFLLACLVLPLVLKASDRQESDGNSLRSVALMFLLGVGAVSFGFAIAETRFSHGRVLLSPTIYFTFFVVALLSVCSGALWIFGRLSRRGSQFVLYTAIALAISFMISLSYPAFEAMIVPGLGLPLAALLDSPRLWQKTLVIFVSLTLVAAETCDKVQRPFGFSKFDERSAKTATTVSSLPEMRGFSLPKPSVEFLDGTMKIIRENTLPGDAIFSYPELGIFYALSGHWCPTATCSHNIDVVNDTFAKSEAKRLLDHPPAVLIYSPEPAVSLLYEEALWRNGNPSGNRAIIAAVEQLARDYKLVRVFRPPVWEPETFVYVRNSHPGSPQLGNGIGSDATARDRSRQ